MGFIILLVRIMCEFEGRGDGGGGRSVRETEEEVYCLLGAKKSLK